MTTTQRYIWIRVDSQSRWLWKHLGHYLAKLTGWRPLLIVTTAEDRRFYETCFGIAFEGEIVVAHDFYAYVVDGGQPGDTLATLRRRAAAYEREYDFSVLRDMLLADRHLGRGFMLDGKGHPRSNMSDKADFRLALGACLMSMDFHTKLADRFPPALMLSWSGGGGIGGKPLAVIARRRNIPFRALASARFRNLYYWAEDELAGNRTLTEFIRMFRQPSAGEVEAAQARVAPNALASAPVVALFREELTWLHILKTGAWTIARAVYARLRGYRRGRVGYRISSVIAASIRTRLDWRWLERHCRPDLKELEGVKLVYFPLQVAPESSTNLLSAHNTNQFGVLMELALSLPADALLVVKEHYWQIGRRPRHIYKDILALPNVVFVHPGYSSLEIVRQSRVVCTLSSSAGFEAAALGKPVLYFHRGSPLEGLSHVHPVLSTRDLAQVRRLLDDDTEASRSTRERDGARFLLALEKFCIDIGSVPFHLRQTPPDTDELARLCNPLLMVAGDDDHHGASALTATPSF